MVQVSFTVNQMIHLKLCHKNHSRLLQCANVLQFSGNTVDDGTAKHCCRKLIPLAYSLPKDKAGYSTQPNFEVVSMH